MNYGDLLKSKLMEEEAIPALLEEDREIVLQLIDDIYIGDNLDEAFRKQGEMEAMMGYLLGKYLWMSRKARRAADLAYHQIVFTNAGSRHDKNPQWRVDTAARNDPEFAGLDERADRFHVAHEFISQLSWAIRSRLRSAEQLSNNARAEMKGMSQSV